MGQPTMNISQARIKFRERCSSMTTCKRQFSSQRFADKENRDLKSLFLCNFCPPGMEKVDVLSHWPVCYGHSRYKILKDLSVEEQLISFYQDIIAMRLSAQK